MVSRTLVAKFWQNRQSSIVFCHHLTVGDANNTLFHLPTYFYIIAFFRVRLTHVIYM